MVLHALHLCSGYGGFELAFKLAGIPTRTVCHVERDSHAAATLVARMEDAHLDLAPVWSDLITFDTEPWVGRVDIITAGFPCQPFSSAGQQRGVDDPRWLWPALERIIGDLGPRYVFLENVPQLVTKGLPHVLQGLASLGFDAEWGLHSAAEVGAPHKRERVWILAYAPSVDEREPHDQERSEPWERARGNAGRCGLELADAEGDGRVWRRPPPSTGRPSEGSGSDVEGRSTWPPGRGDLDGWRRYLDAGGPEPAVRRSAHGRPEGLADSLHLGGNGLVPAVAARAFVELAGRAGIDLWRERND